MKKILALLFISSFAFGFSLNFDPAQTGAVAISSSTVTPTQIFTNDPAATKTCVINTSTTTVYFVGYSTFSALSLTTPSTVTMGVSSGAFSLNGILMNGTSTQTQPFCFDGTKDPYTGPIWATTGVTPSIGLAIQRFRTH